MSTAPNAIQIAQELRKFAFFDGFPPEAMNVFASMAKAVEFEPGQLLLEQGKSNRSLFFLRSGEVVIEVDGENVSDLSSPGEVIGEMSLINRTPVAASVRARTKVAVFQVSEDYVQSLPQNERTQFQNLLDRVYASVLAQRLTRTNEKAKRFEIAHRDLEAAHASLRQINESLETEIGRRSKELVSKVRDLIVSHLQPAQSALSVFARSEQATVKAEDLKPLAASVSEVIDFLKPVAELGQKGRTIDSSRVLFCDPSKKQLGIARLALGGTGVNLSVASTVEDLEGVLGSEQFDLVICDSEMKDAIDKIRATIPQTPLVLLVGLDMKAYLDILNQYPDLAFYVSRDPENRSFTIKNVSTTVIKILNQDYFGMDKYLSWGARIVEKTVRSSDDRAQLIENMEEHFKSLGVRSSFLDSVHVVAEEMLMNAIYDAPVDSSGKPLFNHLPRTEKVALKPEQESKLAYGTDGMYLAVSVTDPFGSLTKGVIKKYLTSNYAGEEIKSADKGGAGRGLHQIIESADVTVFNVKSKVKTEVICLFNLEKNKDADSHHTFHLFFA